MVKKQKKRVIDKKEKGFFSFTLRKVIWALSLLVLTFILSMVFMDVQNNFIDWVFNPITLLFYIIFYGWNSGPEFILPLIPIFLALVWDYFLVCLVYWIIKKIRGKK